MGAAHGGQIVVSLATEELVPEGGVELVDLGAHVLRDLARPERVFQVAHHDLTREFLPLQSLDTLPGNLPVQVTSFVGRDEDLARIVGMFDRASLVTLIGAGGVGKTRLAVQVAAELLPRYADGAWLCELAAVDDADAMAQAIASTVGCLQRPGLSLAESVVEYIKVRELLVVLDNCEHLLDEAGALADAVLRSCPNVSVVATSREALDVAGERVVRVRSLDVPVPSATADELMHSAAVRLFVDRATDSGADTAWGAVQWAAVGEICRRVDGIPLAIELAAARVTSMSPSDIAAHLDERFRLLTGKRRGRVERHQTLRATVEWSYQLLEEDERLVFDRLGVFAGSFDAPAAVAVAGGGDVDTWDVTDAISSLVAKSMLGTETGPDGATRYSLNETLRQYARDRLDEAGDTDHWRRAFAEHYATWAHEAGYGLTGPRDALWIAQLRAELDNIRAAIGWALERNGPDQELALRILASLPVAGRSDAGIALDALAAQAVPAAESARPELRAPVLTLAGYYEWAQGRLERARALAHAAMLDGIVKMIAAPFEPHQAAMTFEITAGNHDRGLEIGSDVRAALDTVDNPYGHAMFLSVLACHEGMAGQFDQARADASRASELARRLGNLTATTTALHGTAWALQRDDPAAALAAAEKYLEFSREHHFLDRSTGSVMALAAGLRARLGDDPGAIDLLHQAVIVDRDQGARPQLAATLDWALSPLRKTGRSDIAATFLGALTGGPIAGVADFPGVNATRARTLERIRADLGDETTNELLARGAVMSYDELVEYAIHHLEPVTATSH